MNRLAKGKFTSLKKINTDFFPEENDQLCTASVSGTYFTFVALSQEKYILVNSGKTITKVHHDHNQNHHYHQQKLRLHISILSSPPSLPSWWWWSSKIHYYHHHHNHYHYTICTACIYLFQKKTSGKIQE